VIPNQPFHSRFPVRRCINLARRGDRWEKVSAQFERHGLRIERQEARDARSMAPPPESWPFSPGAFACALSHSDAVRAACQSGAPAVFIFEDDVELHPDFPALFERFLEELPEDWGGVWLGGIHRSEPEPVSRHVARLVESDSTYAYGLRDTVYREFLDQNGRLRHPVDLVTKDLQKTRQFYCTVPPLAWVSADFSDIQLTDVNYWWLREGLTVDGAQCQEMLQQAGVVVLPSSRGAISADAAHYVVSRYCHMFPEVIVLDDAPPLRRQGSREERQWPANCIFEPVDGMDDRDTQIRFALEKLREDCAYVMVTEIDLYIRPWDLKASLLHCSTKDVVSAAGGVLQLTAVETRQIMAGRHDAINTYPRSRAQGLGGPSFFLARRSALTESREFPPVGTSICHCPVQALRLSSKI
jgi:GR25 family glycosyltransferase involved in LPS biosynthesis